MASLKGFYLASLVDGVQPTPPWVRCTLRLPLGKRPRKAQARPHPLLPPTAGTSSTKTNRSWR